MPRRNRRTRTKRRHTNNDGRRQIKKGKTAIILRKLAREFDCRFYPYDQRRNTLKGGDEL